MAKITKIDPKDFKSVNVVQIDVDARDNWEAIDKLEQWALRNGFARANENFLRMIMCPTALVCSAASAIGSLRRKKLQCGSLAR